MIAGFHVPGCSDDDLVSGSAKFPQLFGRTRNWSDIGVGLAGPADFAKHAIKVNTYPHRMTSVRSSRPRAASASWREGESACKGNMERKSHAVRSWISRRSYTAAKTFMYSDWIRRALSSTGISSVTAPP